MRRRVLLAVLLCLVFGVDAGVADATIYWNTGSGYLGAANDDGSQALYPLPSGFLPAPDGAHGRGLAVDGSHVYWANANGGAIGRSNLDGTGADGAVVSGLAEPCGVAVDASHVYWADREANAIGRANLDGSEVERGFVLGASEPCGVAVDAGHVYWANGGSGSIGRAALDGSGAQQHFIGGLTWPFGVAVDGNHVYWGERVRAASTAGSIARATSLGTDVETQFVPAAGEPDSLAVDGTGIYWANEEFGNLEDGTIGHANLDGSAANRSVIRGIHIPLGVAVDPRVFPAPPALASRPSDYLRLGPLIRSPRRVAVALTVYVPARGDFSVDSPGVGWNLDRGDPPPYVGGSFTWSLTLWPGGGAAGKRLRRQLRRYGHTSLPLRVTYRQEGRLPIEASRRIVFRRPTSR